ncbi:phosphopantetheine-binding protein [Actinoplanes oblitus]|uniref:Phosphopantetheine-binding protein n=1 Tax=Actinoplanes oblitus TaxID=3040509 RepID=A0ABY8WQM2_9ACTN|nr:phosphopantetheine-binding protein [Actinoplanes oblitus]WIN00205.1 phosphopantetheine-binding protein [Actinoplanes oblitus]
MITTMERVTSIFRQQAPDVEVPEIVPEHRMQDLGIDSLTFVHILLQIEKDFAIEFSDEELAVVESVQDILDLVVQKA